MRVTIDVQTGSSLRDVTQQDIQKNISAIQRAIDGKSLAFDFVLLLDTKTILEGIKEKLPKN